MRMRKPPDSKTFNGVQSTILISLTERIDIGNDEEVSINSLVTLVRARLRSESKIIHLAYESVYGPGFEDMLRRVPSVAKLERFDFGTSDDRLLRM